MAACASGGERQLAGQQFESEWRTFNSPRQSSADHGDTTLRPGI